MNSTYNTNNIVWSKSLVSRQDRESLSGHSSAVIWFTGLPGSGKSTLAYAVEAELYKLGCRTYVLDGDNVRHGLCNNLSFSFEDRRENIRRIAEAAKLMVEAGVITLTALISPALQDRQLARELFPPDNFIEIFCNASLEVCEKRDAKGLYKKVRVGEIKDYTGISSPYEPPLKPELVLDTGTLSLEKCVYLVLELLLNHRIIQVSEDNR